MMRIFGIAAIAAAIAMLTIQADAAGATSCHPPAASIADSGDSHSSGCGPHSCTGAAFCALLCSAVVPAETAVSDVPQRPEFSVAAQAPARDFSRAPPAPPPRGGRSDDIRIPAFRKGSNT